MEGLTRIKFPIWLQVLEWLICSQSVLVNLSQTGSKDDGTPIGVTTRKGAADSSIETAAHLHHPWTITSAVLLCLHVCEFNDHNHETIPLSSRLRREILDSFF